MASLLFLCALGGVAWLVFWSLRDHQQLNHPWSPFDMRYSAPPVPRRPGSVSRSWLDWLVVAFAAGVLVAGVVLCLLGALVR